MGDEAVVWGIRGGRFGDADALFLQSDCVALGWHKTGDLAQLSPTREAFKDRVAVAYGGTIKAGAIPNIAGQMFRFVHELKTGDLVAYPSKLDRQVHLGRVRSAYRYGAPEEAFPHRRAVQWLREVPRTSFSQGALCELGAQMSFFQIKTYAEEFRSAAEAKAQPTEIPDNADEAAFIAEDVEETTQDFVLKQLAHELKGHPLAHFVAHVLRAMGYRTRVSPEGPDRGIDILAHKDELGFEPPIVKVQVKSAGGTVGEPLVSALYGTVAPAEFGLFVTLGTFSTQARNFANGKSNLRLIDGAGLVVLVLEHYDRLDAPYKAIIPLKRIYVPEPLDDGVAR